QWILDRWGAPVQYVRSNLDEALVGNMKEAIRWLGEQKGVDVERVHGNVLYAVAFMKGMSTPKSDDFAYLDENEWRIVFCADQIGLGHVVPTNEPLPPFKIRLLPAHLQMVIFPDDRCRDLACADSRVTTW